MDHEKNLKTALEHLNDATNDQDTDPDPEIIQKYLSILLEYWHMSTDKSTLSSIQNILDTYRDMNPRHQMIIVLIHFKNALEISAPVAQLQKLYKHKELLHSFNNDTPEAPMFKKMLERALWSSNLTRHDDGKRFLAFCFGCVAPEVSSWLFEILKVVLDKQKLDSVLSQRTRAVLFAAWKLSEGAIRVVLEDEIETIVLSAIVSEPVRAAKCRQCLQDFHDKREQSVSDLMNRIYPPLLWKFLPVANWKVRLNASALFGVSFPFDSEKSDPEEAQSEMDRQYNALIRIMKDAHPEVRRTGVKASCRILSSFWEILPYDKVGQILNVLLEFCAKDGSSPQVRADVIEGIGVILNNPMSHPAFESVLPTIFSSMNDVHELPRKAFAQLLLKLESIASDGISSLVTPDDIFSRLTAESVQTEVERAHLNLWSSLYEPSTRSAPTAALYAKTMSKSIFSPGESLNSQFAHFIAIGNEFPASLVALIQQTADTLEPLERLRVGGAFLAMASKTLGQFLGDSCQPKRQKRSSAKEDAEEHMLTTPSALGSSNKTKKGKLVRVLYICAEYLLSVDPRHFVAPEPPAVGKRPKTTRSRKRKDEVPPTETKFDYEFLLKSINMGDVMDVFTQGCPSLEPTEDTMLCDLRFELLKILQVLTSAGVPIKTEIDYTADLLKHYRTLSKLWMDFTSHPTKEYNSNWLSKYQSIVRELPLLRNAAKREVSDILVSIRGLKFILEELEENWGDEQSAKDEKTLMKESMVEKLVFHGIALVFAFLHRERIDAFVADKAAVLEAVEFGTSVLKLTRMFMSLVAKDSIEYPPHQCDALVFVIPATLRISLQSIYRNQFEDDELENPVEEFYSEFYCLVQGLATNSYLHEGKSSSRNFSHSHFPFVTMREICAFWTLDIVLRKQPFCQEFLAEFAKELVRMSAGASTCRNEILEEEKSEISSSYNSSFFASLLNAMKMTNEASAHEIFRSFEVLFEECDPTDSSYKWVAQVFIKITTSYGNTCTAAKSVLSNLAEAPRDSRQGLWAALLGLGAACSGGEGQVTKEEEASLEAVRLMMELPSQMVPVTNEA